MNTAVEAHTFKLQTGKYVIIDPCYVYPDKEWHEFCHLIDNGDSWVVTYNGTPFFVWSTAYGDGSYPVYTNAGSKVGSCSVDAGLLSVIPYDLFQSKRAAALGVVVDVTRDCVASVDDSNVMIGTQFTVITKEDEEEYDEDCDCDCSLCGYCDPDDE